ncbi:MAG: hypothetical protein QNJ31_00380 [Candidatus Caenarcaniphilales bacterium]|nr:hypothetical protein [Candidatus Caenarcaniphilales bacterium]
MSWSKTFITFNIITLFLLFTSPQKLLAGENKLPPLDSQLKENSFTNNLLPLEQLSSQVNSSSLIDLPNSPVILEGSATRVINRESKITIQIMTLLSSEFSLEGDKVEAKILVKPSTNKINPLEALRGSIITGRIVEVKPSKKAGRAGCVTVHFDKLRIKSGKEFPISAKMTTESFKGKEASKMIVYDLKLMTLGALWGTYNSLKWAPVAALYTNGLSVALSAGIGVSLGLIGSFKRQGETKSFFPGEREIIEFKDSLSLSDSVLEEAALANQNIESELIGLNLELLESNIIPSEEYEGLLSVKVKVNNYTDSSIYPCDLLLIPQDGGDPVTPDLRTSGSQLLKSVQKGESSTISLMFPITNSYNPNEYSLALVDPLDKAHLSKIPIRALNSLVEREP